MDYVDDFYQEEAWNTAPKFIAKNNTSSEEMFSSLTDKEAPLDNMFIEK